MQTTHCSLFNEKFWPHSLNMANIAKAVGHHHSGVWAVKAPFAWFRSFWMLWQACHFVPLGTMTRRKRNPLLRNKKLDTSQQWTEIRCGNRLTKRGNWCSPRQHVVWWLERKKQLKQILSFSIAKQNKPLKQSPQAWAQMRFRVSSNNVAALDMLWMCSCSQGISGVRGQLSKHIRRTWLHLFLSWKDLRLGGRFFHVICFFSAEPCR